MSGDDYDTCTELLKRLLYSGAIHAFAYEDTISSATIYHMAKVDEEEKIDNADQNGGHGEAD